MRSFYVVLLTLVLTPICSFGQTTVTENRTPGVPIDFAFWDIGDATDDVISISSSFTIEDVRCSVRVTGNPVAYFLTPVLTSPSGTSVILSNFNCCCLSSVNNINVSFGDVTDPFTPANLNNGFSYVMQPCGLGTSMADFDGENSVGDWTLEIFLDDFGTTATFAEWELTVSDTVIGSVPDVEFLRGDSNNDGAVDIADAIYSANALFVPGSPAPPCSDASDANDDGTFNIADVISIANFLFIPGSPPPPPPHPACGVDPTDDTLDCPGFVGAAC